LYAHGLQASRFELKYVIDEALVRPLRQFASSYLVPDEHARADRNWEYDVHSLYLDSPSLVLCRSTMQGLKNRFKLRIRFYDHQPENPVFFEIKRRVSDVILKQRARVHRRAANRLLSGDWPQGSDMATGSDQDFGALQRFCSLRDLLRAEGKVFVSYIREAYVTASDNSVRVTFDRAIRATPFRGGIELPLSEEPLYPAIGGIVLELKFTDRFPNWMRQMAETFDLERCSMAKYVACVQEAARHPLRWQAPLAELRV
jgi:hypothetical protein